MSVYRAKEGTVFTATKEFVSEEGNTLIPSPGYPKVRLRDADKEVLFSALGSAGSEPGFWSVNISVPLINIADKQEYSLRWIFKDTAKEITRETDLVIVSPRVDQRDEDIIVLFGDTDFDVVVPESIPTDAAVSVEVFGLNTSLFKLDIAQADLQRSFDKSSFTVNIPADTYTTPSMASSIVRIIVKPLGGRRRTYTQRLWVISPQIQVAMTSLEAFLNKSRIENVIPELRYNDGDLMMYLERGLNLFNAYGYPTAFTGINMQGSLMDAWLTCATYYALGAQLLAEGSLSFDYSGQRNSLSIDRTPQLDSALGRVESSLDSKIAPLKKLLSASGAVGGDGSVGATNISSSRARGKLVLMNAPTTRAGGFRRGYGWNGFN